MGGARRNLAACRVGGAGRGIPARRAGASPVTVLLAPRTGGEARRQDPLDCMRVDVNINEICDLGPTVEQCSGDGLGEDDAAVGRERGSTLFDHLVRETPRALDAFQRVEGLTIAVDDL